jgi:hypothetical protein
VDTDGLRECAEELDRMAERLADLAMETLREAVTAVHEDPDLGDSAAAADTAVAATRLERRINRARAAVEKAAHLLRSASSDAG